VTAQMAGDVLGEEYDVQDARASEMRQRKT
jgi:hypothetical protein